MDPQLTFRLQAAAFLRRWRGRVRRNPDACASIPATADLPPAARDHYRAFAWVIHEQRLMALLLAALLAACGLIWMMTLAGAHKSAVLVTAGPSLKEAAATFYHTPAVSYDQLAFFLNGCVPLLYAAQEGRHPLLALAEGLAAPDICAEAEKRLTTHAPEMAAHGMTQSLTLTAVTGVVADVAQGRAAARLTGYLTVTSQGAEARTYPWEAQAIVAMNPGGQLDPYPFYLLSLETKAGPSSPSS